MGAARRGPNFLIGKVAIDGATSTPIPSGPLPAGTNNIGKVAETLSTSFTVLQKTVGASAVQLTATATPVTTQPFIRPDPANTGTVVVIKNGSQTMTDGMFVGQGVFVPVDDLSKIWFIASAAGQKVAILAGT